MARFNEGSKTHLATRRANWTARLASLAARGLDAKVIAAKMASMGCGERRAVREIERVHNLVWCGGGFGERGQGHYKPELTEADHPGHDANFMRAIQYCMSAAAAATDNDDDEDAKDALYAAVTAYVADRYCAAVNEAVERAHA